MNTYPSPPRFWIQSLTPTSVERIPLPLNGEFDEDTVRSTGWEVRLNSNPLNEWNLGFRCLQPTGTAAAVGIEFAFESWSRDFYVLAPGAVYAGNRFVSHRLPYFPRLPECETSPDSVTAIADIRRLEIGDGPSGFELLVGDMAIPALGVFDPMTGSASVILIRETGTPFGPFGFAVSENGERTEATLRITVPGVRRKRYEMSGGRIDSRAVSPDTGRAFKEGDEFSLRLEVHEFTCTTVQGLFDRVFDLRGRFEATPPTELPLSQAAELVRDHFNNTMWWPEAGLYRTNPLGGKNPYQTGWCGGIMAQYALLALFPNDPLTRQRCHTHLDHALTEGVSPCGLLFGKYTPDLKWESDCWADETHPWRRQFTLTRRHGDALFYALKACGSLESRNEPVPASWLAACRGMADALCRIWDRHGQWGQYLDQLTGEVRLGNSVSGGLIPGALAAAYTRFAQPKFRDAALAGGEHLYSNFTAKGLTTGGPGDTLQAPDSESSYALVESFWSLHALTGDPLWLERCGEAARQFASWVIPYDYPFPEGTEFHRLGVRTAGTLFANAQNAHAAPICTHSGLALFRLFRATNDRRYLDLLVTIVRAIPQLVSREDRPVHDKNGRALPAGWINERVNTSDWDNNVGGVFYGPTWCETALLLTAAELPGVYVRAADRTLAVMDNLDAQWDGIDGLILTNATKFPATARVWLDDPSRDSPRESDVLVPAESSIRVVTILVS